ncbi:hypothetical protein F0L68_05550 [Solihabitans fulvus]|uniref:Excreted virulence factor EspC, type VII ESX diderm n=1 Tax=Solihabitans fulvus TaxID=1892852 RepID=A0A5B2XN43_9PSEU|nr:hypothetical protein [Solihabitans fulvus]KAA2264575.1 hypothetical protein F0L68_05550 [Solihabitans fulvus]
MPQAYMGEFAGGLAGISQAVTGLKAAAAEGFAISDAGGQALIKAIDTLSNKLDSALQQASILGQEPPLGLTPAAQVYKPFLATIATDPEQGLVPALKQLQQDLKDTKDSIQQSMESYQATDQSGKQGLHRAAGPTYSV